MFDPLQEIQKAVGLTGILFESEFRFVEKQLADFFEISERTIENYVEKYEKEIDKNGYEVIKGKQLSDFKLVVQHLHVPEMNFVNTPCAELSISLNSGISGLWPLLYKKNLLTTPAPLKTITLKSRPHPPKYQRQSVHQCYQCSIPVLSVASRKVWLFHAFEKQFKRIKLKLSSAQFLPLLREVPVGRGG